MNQGANRTVAFLAAALFLAGVCGWADTGEPPATPDDPASARFTLRDVHDRMLHGTNLPKRAAAFQGPSAGPLAPAMPRTDELLDAFPAPHGEAAGPDDVVSGRIFWALGGPASSWGSTEGAMPVFDAPPAGASLPAGLHAGAEWAEIVPMLKPANVISGVTLFGVSGVGVITEDPPAPVAKTGYTLGNRAGDDGNLQEGVAWPDPRFEVLTGSASNCVRDHLTGLVWLRSPAQHAVVGAALSFSNAVEACEALSGEEGLGEWTNWRLPSLRELESVIDYGSQTWIEDSIFSVPASRLWTSTLRPQDRKAWLIDVGSSRRFSFSVRPVDDPVIVNGEPVFVSYFTWPVAGPDL